MDSFRRIALLMAFAASTVAGAQAQNPAQTDPAKPTAVVTSGAASVQARIRARREQRRAAAIHDAYAHRYEAFAGTGYLRQVPGPSQQRTTLYAWDFALTRYHNDRLGITVDARGNYGTAYVGLNKYGLTRPSVSEYSGMIGPTYRFYMQPKYSVSGRVMAGGSYGNFSSDSNGYGSTTLGLYPDGAAFITSASVVGEYNVSPTLSVRLAPEYTFTGFGSTVQASRGFSAGFVYRFGK